MAEPTKVSTIHAAFGLRISGVDHYYEVSLCGLNGEHSRHTDRLEKVSCGRCIRVLKSRKTLILRKTRVEYRVYRGGIKPMPIDPPAIEGYSSAYNHLRVSRVRIRAGTPVRSANPKRGAPRKYPYMSRWYKYGSTRVVKVKEVYPGLTLDGTPTEDPLVRWGGQGGYWMEAPARMVERVGPEE